MKLNDMIIRLFDVLFIFELPVWIEYIFDFLFFAFISVFFFFFCGFCDLSFLFIALFGLCIFVRSKASHLFCLFLLFYCLVTLFIIGVQ